MNRASGSFRRRRSSGAELLELGLVLGLILLPVLFGIIEFGTYFYVEHNFQAAAREGARAGCVSDCDPTAVGDAITRVLDGSRLGTQNLQFDWEVNKVPDPSDEKISYCVVTVSTTWDKVPQGLRPMLMIRDAANSVIEGKATMRVEQ